jgi:4-diphosphocytidyl-2-C-methyl-D-erythritol kinase
VAKAPLGRSQRVAALAYAKLNLHLEVLGRRPDGFHELVSLFQSVDLADRLTFTPVPSAIQLRVRPAGLGLGRGNLVVRALELLRAKYGVRRGMRVTLEKRIPVGAGMGGGSSDAAAALVAGARAWGIRPSAPALLSLARELGSDVPFFLKGGACWMGGRGEIRLGSGRLPAFVAVVAVPKFPVPTARAYQLLGIPLTRRWRVPKVSDYSFHLVANTKFILHGSNSFQAPLEKDYPGLARLRACLRAGGARGVRITGSGSAVFGIVDGEDSASQLCRQLSKAGYRSWTVRPTERGHQVTERG